MRRGASGCTGGMGDGPGNRGGGYAVHPGFDPEGLDVANGLRQREDLGPMGEAHPLPAHRLGEETAVGPGPGPAAAALPGFDDLCVARPRRQHAGEVGPVVAPGDGPGDANGPDGVELLRRGPHQ